MKRVNVMQRSFVRGIILSLLLVTVLVSIQPINEVLAQEKEITAKSISFEKTSIIEFENKGDSEVTMFRLWLGDQMTFKSFKTEQGWTATKTPEGVLVFVTTQAVQLGDTVKFGIKTDQAKPGINWKALDKNNEQIEIGKTLSTESSSGTSSAGSSTVSSKASFRVIPEKPNVGSTIRVTGEGFEANHEFDFYLDNKKLTTFQTDSDGFFMTTSKIPTTTKADRVNFSIKDNDASIKEISLRLGEALGRLSSTQEVPLTVKGLKDVTRGEKVSLTGTAGPGRSVTAKIIDPTGEIITTNATDVDSNGNWAYETLVPVDATLGFYTAEITDGKQTLVKTWTVKSSKTIEILPIKLKFDAGETLKFNGTATPNEKLELSLENPQGIEVFADILEVGNDGRVEFEHTTDVSYLEGTYVLFATQKDVTEIVLIGLGELPEEQIVVKLDKLNYKDGETAIITVDGPPSSTLSLIIVDPSDKNKFTDPQITLDPDGIKAYELDLTGYSTGIYTVVVKKGNSQDSQVFSVGLQTGSGAIDIRTTKDTYSPGDSILLLGTSGKNILVKLTLIDPDGDEVRVKDSFTNKDGHMSDSSFRIPTNAKTGTWTLNAKSGSNFDNAEFSVHTPVSEGLSIFVESTESSYQGDLLNIKGFGAAPSKTIFVKILSPSDDEIETLNVISTSSGEFSTIWLVPKDLSPGEYTIRADDNSEEADTTFTVEE